MQHFNPIQSKWVIATQIRSVTTIKPIWHSHPVHHGTKFKVLISLKSKEIIIFAHNFILKQNTSHCLDFHLSIIFLVKGLDTSNQLQSICTLSVQTIVSAV